MKKRFFRILSLILLIIGLSLIEPKTTGAVIGASSSSIIGILLILISGILFAARESLEYKIKHHDPKAVKSFRRWIEKKEHRKIPNEEAEHLYEAFEKKYWNSISKGIIQKSDKHRPLKYIEDFIKDLKEQNETYDHLLDRTKGNAILNEAGQSLKERRIYTKASDLIGLAQRCGYDTSEIGKEGTLVKKENGVVLQRIPNSPTINRYTAKSIMKSLATGESSF